MSFLKNKEAVFVALILIFFLGLGLWGYFGKWFPYSPQDIAEQRGITIGKIESTNSDRIIKVLFENESVGRKRIKIYPDAWEITFIPDQREYVRLFFEIKGVKGCERLSDEELIKKYLQKIEVHYIE